MQWNIKKSDSKQTNVINISHFKNFLPENLKIEIGKIGKSTVNPISTFVW